MGKSIRLTVEELTLRVTQEIFAYNNKEHRSLGISPDAALKRARTAAQEPIVPEDLGGLKLPTGFKMSATGEVLGRRFSSGKQDAASVEKLFAPLLKWKSPTAPVATRQKNRRPKK
jgi:hypothetical protein